MNYAYGLYAADGRKLQTTHRGHAFVNYQNTGIDELRDHCGEYVYRNDTLERVTHSTGYWTGGRASRCFVRDYQGNVRAVLDESGTMLEYNATSVTTSTADPLAAETPQLSPYAWCADNPVRNTDPSGKDITILNRGNYWFQQHLAMLIQNEQGKWQYYSINGNNMYISGFFSGGRRFNDVAVGSWDSPQEFINSDYNRDGNSNDRSINSYRYTEGYIIKTDKEQDRIMSESFKNIANNEDYDLTNNNCATVVQRVMLDAGLKIHDEEPQIIHYDGNPLVCIPPFDIKVPKRISGYPSDAFKEIISVNPQGKMIKHE